MSVKRETFSPEYHSLVNDISNFIDRYNISTTCKDCSTELEIATITISKEWDSYSILTRVYCDECQRSRNYYKVIT